MTSLNFVFDGGTGEEGDGTEVRNAVPPRPVHDEEDVTRDEEDIPPFAGDAAETVAESPGGCAVVMSLALLAWSGIIVWLMAAGGGK